jgi:hypothetical protein
MFGTKKSFFASAVLALSLMAAPANAAFYSILEVNGGVLTPGSGADTGVSASINPVLQSTTYEITVQRTVDTAFTDTFTLNYPALFPTSGSAVNISLGDLRGFASLVLNWYSPGHVLERTLDVLTDGNVTVPLALLGSGAYILELVGSTVGNPQGGSYFVNLTVGPGGPGDTPLPGAVVLFGSVIAGVGGLQVMRRRRKA